MDSLSERESGSKFTRNCVYLSKIKNSFYYQELDWEMSSLSLGGVMQSYIICSLEIHNWCKWLDRDMGK